MLSMIGKRSISDNGHTLPVLKVPLKMIPAIPLIFENCGYPKRTKTGDILTIFIPYPTSSGLSGLGR